ncbi:MAG: Slp family lipoprotein [Pseudomonadota bacterium]
MMIVRTLTALLLVIVTGCATQPAIDGTNYDATIVPDLTTQNIENFTDRGVIWGGVILSTTNQENGSQVEVLAYPLDRNYRPKTSGLSTGRFLVTTDSFLEPVDYAPGKPLTASGRISGSESSTVGQASVDVPVLKPDELHLWSKKTSGIRPTFGIGVSLGF